MHKLTLILSLVLISSALSKIHSSLFTDPSLLNPRTTSPSKKLSATKSGNVPLYKDDAGFYVEVDLLYDSTTKSGSVIGPDTVPMMLGLYTSQTLLTYNCLHFNRYDCKKYKCNAHEQDIDNRNYLYFTPESYWAGVNLYLDYVNWGYKAGTLIATNCITGAQDTYGADRSGVLGMGTSLDGKSNFNASNPIFSLAIADDFKSGELLFKKDLHNHAQSATPVTVLKASRDWVSTLSGTIEIGEKTIELDAKLIFDISSQSVGFPLNLYEQVIENLGEVGVTDCLAGSTYQPSCTYKGKYEDLPNITLVSGNMKVEIPPKVYVLNYVDQTSVTLNLKGLSSERIGSSFVTSTYQNYIVLDARFLNYYYAVFEYQDQDGTTITLYKSGKGAVDPDDGDGSYWWIILIVLLVLIVVGCVVMFLRKKRKNERTSAGNDSIHAPFNVSGGGH